MAIENRFKVGDLVVLKTHPLLESYRIKGDGKSVPPILMIREVFIENRKKQVCDTETGEIIADRIKYTCVYFNDIKSEFVDCVLYESMLETFDRLKIERISKIGEISDISDTIIEEIKKYKIPKYEYGKIVRFKTKRIEIYKKRSSKKFLLKKGKINIEDIEETVQYVVNYTSPDFILCGFKKNEVKNSFYPDGSPQRLVSEKLFKVKWFNPIQQKFSDQYLPESLLTDEMKFN